VYSFINHVDTIVQMIDYSMMYVLKKQSKDRCIKTKVLSTPKNEIVYFHNK